MAYTDLDTYKETDKKKSKRNSPKKSRSGSRKKSKPKDERCKHLRRSEKQDETQCMNDTS